MLICPHGGRVRDPRGSEDVLRDRQRPLPEDISVYLMDLSAAEQVAIAQTPVYTWTP